MTMEFGGISEFSGGRVTFAHIKDPGEETLHVMSGESGQCAWITSSLDTAFTHIKILKFPFKN